MPFCLRRCCEPLKTRPKAKLKLGRRRLRLAFFTPQISVLSRRLFEGLSRYMAEHSDVKISQWNSAHLVDHALVKTMGFDGIVVEGLPNNDISILPARVPAICASSLASDCPIPRLCDDQEWAGIVAARYLIKRGFRHFAYCGYSHHHGSIARGTGFRSELESMGRTCAWFEFTTSANQDVAFNSNADQARLREWIRKLSRPCALFVFCDAEAVVAYQCSVEAGLKVPEDIAIMGVDNDPFLKDALPISLSSIDLGSVQTGYQVTAALVRWIKTGIRPPMNSRVRAVHVAPGQTTDLHYVEDELVQRALDLIGDRSGKAPPVPAIAQRLGCSKRTLERHFHDALGVSVYETIQRERLEHAQQWLASSQIPLKTVAAHCGYSGSQHLCNAFKARLGMTPQSWRRQGAAPIAMSRRGAVAKAPRQGSYLARRD